MENEKHIINSLIEILQKNENINNDLFIEIAKLKEYIQLILVKTKGIY